MQAIVELLLSVLSISPVVVVVLGNVIILEPDCERCKLLKQDIIKL